MQIQIEDTKFHKLVALSEITNQPIEQMLDDALKAYIHATEEKLSTLDSESRLGFDEFWDGVDLD